MMCHNEPRKSEPGNISERNALLVYHSLSNGYGKAGLSRLSALFGIHDMTQSVFMNHADILYKAMTDFYEVQQTIERETVSEVAKMEGVLQPCDEKIRIGVGFDGTWLTRGHKSHIGAGFVIDMATEFVLDHEVLSYFSKACSTMKNKLKTKERFEEWRDKIHTGKCQMNFNGLSGRMEAECAL